jgi:hypothetical protein
MSESREWIPVDLLATRDNERGKLPFEWRYVLSNPAEYSAEAFSHTALELVLHPERNSKNIRRADILSDISGLDVEEYASVTEMHCTRIIRRLLMPRNPNIDEELEQRCSFYACEGQHPTLVIYRSERAEKAKLPYYVPNVRAVAFELQEGKVYLAYLPFPGSEIDMRLQRVALNLLRTMHRHWYPYAQLHTLTAVLELRKDTKNVSSTIYWWINLCSKICTFN